MTAPAAITPAVPEETWETFIANVPEYLLSTVLNSVRSCEATGVVRFENHVLDSSHLGDRSWLVIGPRCTYRSEADVRGQHLGATPSVFQEPVAWASVPQELRYD